MLLTPLMLCILGLMFGAGQLLMVRQTVSDAARTAADSAVIASSPAGAAVAAEYNGLAVLLENRAGCASSRIETDTADFVPGGAVYVTVACSEDLRHLPFTPLHGSFVVRAESGAVVEPYRQLP